MLYLGCSVGVCGVRVISGFVLWDNAVLMWFFFEVA